MRRALGNRVTQWARPEMGWEETLMGASPGETRNTWGRLSWNMITGSQTAENHAAGSDWTIGATVTLTLIDRGVRVQWAPHSSISGSQAAGQMFEKTQEDVLYKITGEIPNIMNPGGTLCPKINQTQIDTVIEMVLRTREGRAVLAQREVSSNATREEEPGSPRINPTLIDPLRDTGTCLSTDMDTEPRGRTAMRTLSKRSLTGQKKTDFSSGKVTGLEVWTDSHRGTWTPKCPARGSKDGPIRSPITRTS